MNFIKNIALSALLTIGAFGAVMYTSCNKDECKDVTCLNGGTCSGGNCVCPTGYEGVSCETLAITKYTGSWSGNDQCTSGNYTITLTVAQSSGSVNAIITNPGGFGGTVTIVGNMASDNSSLTFTNASVGGGRTLTGTMDFTSSTAMTFNYTVTPATGAADVCTGTYVKL